MERTGACVVFLVFSVFRCSAETGSMPSVSMSCDVTYEGGVRCETPLNFSRQQGATYTCQLVIQHAKGDSSTEENKPRTSSESTRTSPSKAPQDSCSVALTTSHDFLLVEYGHRAELNCSVPNKAGFHLRWETSIKGNNTMNDTSVGWRTESLTDWETNNNNMLCFLTWPNNTQCTKTVHLTLYKRPDSVKISSESDVWSEGQTMKLQCEIQNVAPVQNVTVQWTRIHQNERQEPVEEMSFGSFSFSGSPRVNGTVNATLEVNVSRADDGAQYQCAALLTLDQLQHPEVERSHLLSITVHYKPTITQPSSGTVSVTRGDSLNLACLAHGNPSPQYVWTSPGNQNHTNSTLTIDHIQPKHQGQYNCTAINGEGSDSVTVEVTVVEDYLPIIASCAAVAVVLLVTAFCIWYGSYYRHTHMGHYILKNLTSRRHNANVAHSDVDQSEL